MKFYNGSYNSMIYDPVEFRKYTRMVRDNLRKLRKKVPFDAIAVTGKSGMAFAFGLQMICEDFPFLAVAKPNDNNHGQKVESKPIHDINSYLILDDCIASGNTVKRIVKTIDEYCNDDNKTPPTCAGIGLYMEGGWAPYEFKVGKMQTVTVHNLFTSLK